MFTGIIESQGKIVGIEKDGSNVHFSVASPISSELKIDQSVAHDGCCLTVVELFEGGHQVTAIAETLEKTSLGAWAVGQKINLERCMKMGGRLDGHIVQGHVDQRAKCLIINELDGSWVFRFGFDGAAPEHFLVSKGSVTVNGVSLTVVDPTDTEFSVCIIPYTFENTNFSGIRVGSEVNLEFDILGKYVARLFERRFV